MRVAVIGAGLGGLGAALRLQGAGHDVTVVEQRERPGGRAHQIADGGYTWDTGPSLITMPWVLEETFAAGGIDLHSEVTLRKLDPFYRIFWAGEEDHFDFSGDHDRMVAEIAKGHGLKWGGDWSSPDLPHFQWGRCKASPSDEARRILREQGMPAVWRAVSAA